MLIARVLTSEEWAAERGERLPPRGEHLAIVVERDGELVGACHLFTAVHWDGWWIAPGARGRGAVLKGLIDTSLTVLQEAGLDTVYTGVEDERADVAALLEHFGFRPAPGRLFLLKVNEAALQIKE
jgi:hypothetical protein